MASKAFIRTILVAVLVVTAHSIKPFTFGSITLQALGTARSLSVVMPETAAERIEHAHHLASIYGKGLFDDTPWSQPNMLQSSLVAFANSVETLDDADIKDVKPGDLNRKSAPKRPVKRIKRDENRDGDTECAKNSEIANQPSANSSQSISFVTPNHQPRLYNAGFITTAVRSELAKPQVTRLDCDLVKIQTVALIHHLPKLSKLENLKVELVLISQPASLTAVCRDASVTKVETAEVAAEIVVGPEEELDEAAAEEQEMAPPVEISVPRAPECIRIP